MAPLVEVAPGRAEATGGTAGGYLAAFDARDGRAREVILLSVYSQDDIEETLAHEVIHALGRTGRFTPAEWAALSHPGLLERWRERYGIDHLYADRPAGVRVEECVAASLAGAWAEAGRRPRLAETGDPDPEIAAAARRAEAVFRAVAGGEIGPGPRTPPFRPHRAGIGRDRAIAQHCFAQGSLQTCVGARPGIRYPPIGAGYRPAAGPRASAAGARSSFS